MRRSIFLYLVILLGLTNVFTYSFLSSQVKFEQTQSDAVNKKFTDTVLALKNKIDEADYFSLKNNQNAQDYFENKQIGSYIEVSKLIPAVTDKLKEYNTDANGNKYLDQMPLNGKKFIVNKVKVLNHRWIIADFNNGELWGEALIKYFVNEDGSISFENMESLVYAK